MCIILVGGSLPQLDPTCGTVHLTWYFVDTTQRILPGVQTDVTTTGDCIDGSGILTD